MELSDWLLPTLKALPAILWMILGLGLPWSLVVLPRRDWQNRIMIACLSLAFGPGLLTAWMFILGTLGMDNNPNPDDSNLMQTSLPNLVGGTRTLTPEHILGGTVMIALMGFVLVWRKSSIAQPAPRTEKTPLAFDERLLIALMIIATISRWFLTSYLDFGEWDPLWVYGYQGKVYTLTGFIPADIGYYPQFLPLQYAYTQIVAGSINDHYAHAVIPFLQVGSILATYILGSRLFNRRIGIIASALWALYPHFGYWTRVGDLEIPLAFMFTGASAFFLMAWTESNTRLWRRYAIIAGLFFGLAMWTKPTAGAFVWGVLLLLIVDFLRFMATHNPNTQGFISTIKLWLFTGKRFEVAFITGLASIPLGAVWYVRNLLLGHDALVFPPSFWLDHAERSGAEFGWILLAIGVLLAYIYIGKRERQIDDMRVVVVGVMLVALGLAPSILNPHRMIWWEWLAFATGLALIAYAVWQYAKQRFSESEWLDASKLGWTYLLALPYFVTWFYSYSYHYRLSFPIVPLLLLPTAVILGRWFTAERIYTWSRGFRLGYASLILVVALNGTMIFAYDVGAGWSWLSVVTDPNRPPSALTQLVWAIQDYVETHDEPPVIVAPWAQRLPFYFPELDIRVAESPRRYDEVDGVTLFVDGSDAIVGYTLDGESAPFSNQFLTGIRREGIANLLMASQDPTFYYELYELHLEQRFEQPEVDHLLEQEVIAGGFARLVGYSFSTDSLSTDSDVTLRLVWEVLDTTTRDMVTFVHLITRDDFNTVLAGWDGPVSDWDRAYYSTRFWEMGEFVIDERLLRLPPDVNLAQGQSYFIRIGLYDETGRVEISVNGEPTGDGILLEVPLQIAGENQ